VRRVALIGAGAVLFAVLATANSGGYRYGVSDQAYYTAAQAHAADPGLFPRDAPLLSAQSQFMAIDDVIGGVSRTTGVGLPALSLIVYLLTLAMLYAAALSFARALNLSPWAIAAFVLLLTLRHRIPKTGANTLEGYMHPRLLAFALGVAALACVLRGRTLVCVGLVAVAALVHTTTALWFGLAVIAATFVNVPAWRPGVAAVAGAGAIGAAWVTSLGPLGGRLLLMDDGWLDVIRGKDYLFAAAWPAYAWILNLGAFVLLAALFARRRHLRAATARERGLVIALGLLVALFLASVPLTEAHIALAVQLQVNRVFWLVDLALAAVVAWWLMDDWGRRAGRAGRLLAFAGIAAFSIGRGVYVTALEGGRPLIRVDLPDTPWVDAMRWLRTQPSDWHVLADPAHSWKYGPSVRVAALRDTVLEGEKDTALAMYDRAVAQRVAERTQALADFETLSTTDVRALDARFDLDAVVVPTAHTLELPVLYRNAGFTIYDLR
jgi:hypothetical protein